MTRPLTGSASGDGTTGSEPTRRPHRPPPRAGPRRPRRRRPGWRAGGRARWRSTPPTERTRTTRRDHTSAARARTTSPHVSYQGHTMGPRNTTASRLQPSARGIPHAVGPAQQDAHDHARPRATPRPAPRRPARGCAAPAPKRVRTWESAKPTAVAGSSHEFTRPGSERFHSQAQPSPDASETTAITASADEHGPNDRTATRRRAGACAPAHSHPMKTTAEETGDLHLGTEGARARCRAPGGRDGPAPGPPRGDRA